MHHLMREFMNQCVRTEIVVLCVGFAHRLYPDALKGNHENAPSAHVHPPTVLRTTCRQVRLPVPEEAGPEMLPIFGRRRDSPRQSRHQFACCLKIAPDFPEQCLAEFPLGFELKVLGPVNEPFRARVLAHHLGLDRSRIHGNDLGKHNPDWLPLLPVLKPLAFLGRQFFDRCLGFGSVRQPEHGLLAVVGNHCSLKSLSFGRLPVPQRFDHFAMRQTQGNK